MNELRREDTLLITGGAGFIGSNLARYAVASSPARIVVLDKLTYAGSLENLTEISDDPRFTFVRADIAERDDVRAVFDSHRPTAVLNLAAESHVDRSIDGPGEFIHTNIVGTFELLEASRAYLAAAPEELTHRFRFLHVSTDEVFGSLGEEGLFEESTPYDPRSPYSASKASADHLVRAYHHTYGLPAIVTNCSNNYGPYQYPEKLIPVMILNALEGKPLPIYGDGKNVRDWIHVEDHCNGILLALTRGALGSSYNLGGNNERTNLQVVDAICDALEDALPASRNPALKAAGVDAYTDLKQFVTDRPGHDRRYAIDATRAISELSWRPRFHFESGLGQTVRWYLDNQEWCQLVTGETDRERLGLGG